MRLATILCATLLATALSAQQTGRHFQRPERTVATPAASPVVDATAKSDTRVEPLRRLRSGRAWSAHHFSRRPDATPAATPPTGAAVDASKPPETRRTAFWGRRVRSS